MPQMSPMFWLIMLNITMTSLMLTSTLIFFTHKPLTFKPTSPTSFQKNWKW